MSLSQNNLKKFGLAGQAPIVLANYTRLETKGSTAIYGICTDYSGNVYVSDGEQHVILKIDSTGNVSVLTRTTRTTGNNGGNTVSTGTALFNQPGGLACDKSGAIYVADAGNNQIRKIDGDKVSLVAGDPAASSGYVNGVNAQFFSPYDVAVDNSGILYVADTLNNAIRIIRGGTTWTLAGTNTPGDALGSGTNALFNLPHSVAVDKSGRLYVSDTGNFKIKTITGDGMVSWFSGSGSEGSTLGTAATSTYQVLKFIDIDPSGDLYVIDFANTSDNRLLRIDKTGTPHLVFDFSYGTDTVVTGVAVDQSSNLYVTESEYVELYISIGPGGVFTRTGDFGYAGIGYTGGNGTTAEIIINGTTFVIGIVGGSFVWDIGGTGTFIFTSIGQSIERSVGLLNFTITWDGVGSILFSLNTDVQGPSVIPNCTGYSSSAAIEPTSGIHVDDEVMFTTTHAVTAPSDTTFSYNITCDVTMPSAPNGWNFKFVDASITGTYASLNTIISQSLVGNLVSVVVDHLTPLDQLVIHSSCQILNTGTFSTSTSTTAAPDPSNPCTTTNTASTSTVVTPYISFPCGCTASPPASLNVVISGLSICNEDTCFAQESGHAKNYVDVTNSFTINADEGGACRWLYTSFGTADQNQWTTSDCSGLPTTSIDYDLDFVVEVDGGMVHAYTVDNTTDPPTPIPVFDGTASWNCDEEVVVSNSLTDCSTSFATGGTVTITL